MEQTLEFEDFPSRSLTVLLFKDVTNSKEIRQLVMDGLLQPECSMLNATLVPKLLAVHTAAWKALQAQQRSQLRTRSLHAEVVFGVSGSRHISESLSRFGVNEDSTHLLIARFDATPADLQALRSLVRGTGAPLSTLPHLADEELLHKYYKLAPQELTIGSLGGAALMRIAARDC